MQWYRAWWKDEQKPGFWGNYIAQGMTRAKNQKDARAKIEAAIGHPVDGIDRMTGDMLKHRKCNKQHYLWVD